MADSCAMNGSNRSNIIVIGNAVDFIAEENELRGRILIRFANDLEVGVGLVELRVDAHCEEIADLHVHGRCGDSSRGRATRSKKQLAFVRK